MGKKILLMGSKTTQIMWPHHRTCLQAGANARKYGYFLFISILPSNLLSHWQFFFFSKQETKRISSDFLPASNPTPICPRVLRARQRSWHWGLLFCSELRDLPWPGSQGSGGANALSCVPAASPRIQPTGHLVSPPCYAHSSVWEVETFCSIQQFFFFTFLQTRMREERREYWPVCDIMLLVHI